jgi:hypothetical protein
MTVVLDIPWQWVAVSGTGSDGAYSPYDGRLTLPVVPGQDVVLTRLTPATFR